MSKLTEDEREELNTLRYEMRRANEEKRQREEVTGFLKFLAIGSVQWIVGGIVIMTLLSPILKGCLKAKYEGMRNETEVKYR